jgi:hypothetical protein
MTTEEFVERVSQAVTDLPGFPRLQFVFAELIQHENIVLMGRGAMDYSRHRNAKIRRSDSHIILPCHSDHTEHKNHC